MKKNPGASPFFSLALEFSIPKKKRHERATVLTGHSLLSVAIIKEEFVVADRELFVVGGKLSVIHAEVCDHSIPLNNSPTQQRQLILGLLERDARSCGIRSS